MVSTELVIVGRCYKVRAIDYHHRLPYYHAVATIFIEVDVDAG